MKKNLILGLLNNYTYTDVNKFILSLEATGYKGDLVLFLGNNTGQLSVMLFKQHGVSPQFFDSWSSLPKGNQVEQEFKFRQPINYFNYRHYLYYDFLSKHIGDYEYVMLTDVTDVVFQADPFSFEIGDKLCCALEPQTIANCATNSKWMNYIYGTEVAEKIGTNNISCAGTTWGSARLILAYEKLMLQELEKVEDAKIAVDQAIHNYFIYTSKIGPVRLMDNNDGIVFTVGYEQQFSITQSGEILNGKGLKPLVVHQFDTKPAMKEMLDKKYPISQLGHKLLKADLFLNKAITKLIGRN